jgi:NTE family protein
VYRAVATDMLSGEMVTPADVSLFTAMRASMSVPGVFAPITVDGRVLGDGGLVRNLPVELARELGADVVIAVNLGTPLGGPEVLETALGMAQQMIAILTEQNVARSLRELQPQDVLVTPELGEAGFLAFDRIGPNIEAGMAAARAQATRLAPLAVSPEGWTEYRRRRTGVHEALVKTPPTASAVRSKATSPGGRRRPVLADLQIGPGVALTPHSISDAAARLTRELEAERVETVVMGDGPTREVVLLPIVSPQAGSRLRLGLDLSADLARSSEFILSGLYTRGALNVAGGEWRTLARIGAVNELQTEWFQPLAAGSPWFVGARLGYVGDDVTVYEEGSLRPGFVARARMGTGSVALGRRLSDKGKARLGVQYRRLKLQTAIPDTGESFALSEHSLFGDIRFDTLDSLAFPTRGFLLALAVEDLGRADDSDPVSGRFDSRIDALYAARSGLWAGHVYAAGLRSALNVTVPLALGGFLRLSGAPADSVVGERIAFGRAALARQVATLPATFGGAVRVGLSLEAGKASPAGGLSASTLRSAGSLFAMLETRFGPVYVALGHTRHVGSAAYLFLGSVLLPPGLLR